MNDTTRSVALIGGGTMGADIAATFAAHGWIAHIVNPHDAMRETLEARLRSAMDKLGSAYDAAKFPLHEKISTLPWENISIAIEAVSERLDLKQEIFEE